MKKLLVANWKENKTLKEATSWLDSFLSRYSRREGVEVVVCPSVCYLSIIKGGLEAGVQDVSKYDFGAHTGEVSAKQVKDFAKYAIVGHSERNEAEEDVDLKIKNCVEAGITPIVCLKDAKDFSRNFPKEVVLVWEDAGNISQDGQYRDLDINRIKSFMQSLDTQRPVMYGGSVNESNIESLEEAFPFAGYLVGHASLDPQTFVSIFQKLKV